MTRTSRDPAARGVRALVLCVAAAGWLAAVHAGHDRPRPAALDALARDRAAGAGPRSCSRRPRPRDRGARAPPAACTRPRSPRLAAAAATAARRRRRVAARRHRPGGRGPRARPRPRPRRHHAARRGAGARPARPTAARRSRRPAAARSPRAAAARRRPRVLVPTTRRGFLQLGAGSVTTAAIGGMAARGVLPATAEANTLTFQLTITDGFRRLVDRPEGFFRGFKVTGATAARLPGPADRQPGAGRQREGDLRGRHGPRACSRTTRRATTRSSSSDRERGARRDPVVGPTRIPARGRP